MIDPLLFSEWRNHPGTEALVNAVKSQIDNVTQTSKLHDSVDKTAMRVAYDEGEVEGLRIVQRWIDDMKAIIHDRTESAFESGVENQVDNRSKDPVRNARERAMRKIQQ